MKGVAIYGGLLAVSLVGSYMRWTAEPEEDLDGKVVMLQGDADDIEKIVWKGADDEAVLDRKSDVAGPYWWVTYTKTESGKKPLDPHAGLHKEEEGEHALDDAPAEDEGAAEEEEPKTTVSVFKGGKNADELLTDLSPLYAVRKLEDVTADKLAQIELEAPEQYVEITRNGRVTKLEVGGEAYGTRDLYVRHVATGDVYLVDDETLRPLKYARTRLPDRDLTPFETNKVLSAVVGDSTNSVTLNQLNKDDKAAATWVPANNPEDTAEQYKTWMDKFLRLKASTYADPADPPKDLELRFQVTLNAEGGDQETVEMYQEGADGDWYGRSAYTREYVKMLKSSASGLADDVSSLIGS